MPQAERPAQPPGLPFLFRTEETDAMAIDRWDPFREAVSLSDAMNALFRESYIRPGSGAPGQQGPGLLPLDISENENEFMVKASLPGVKPEDVQITVHGDTLTIQGETKSEEEKQGQRWHLRERRSGQFQRSLSLATPVDSDKAQANFEHGVLTLTLPKSEQAKPRQIKIGSR
jgi:HSP20 family protein